MWVNNKRLNTFSFTDGRRGKTREWPSVRRDLILSWSRDSSAKRVNREPVQLLQKTPGQRRKHFPSSIIIMGRVSHEILLSPLTHPYGHYFEGTTEPCARSTVVGRTQGSKSGSYRPGGHGPCLLSLRPNTGGQNPYKSNWCITVSCKSPRSIS